MRSGEGETDRNIPQDVEHREKHTQVSSLQTRPKVAGPRVLHTELCAPRGDWRTLVLKESRFGDQCKRCTTRTLIRLTGAAPAHKTGPVKHPGILSTLVTRSGHGNSSGRRQSVIVVYLYTTPVSELSLSL